MNGADTNRRLFLRFLAGSPLAALLPCGGLAGAAERVPSAAAAIDIFDLEATAAGNIPVAHWGYLATGVNDEATLRANRTAFEHYYVRSRRMLDVSRVDMSVELAGRKWPTPIVLAPVASQKAYHAEGEIGSAKAAKARDHLQLLSTVSSTSVEDVVDARGEPIWFQLYTMGGWPGVRDRVRRAEAAGCPVLVLTVDLAGGTGARHTLQRAIAADTRDCDACHAGNGIAARNKPMLGDFPDDSPELVLDWQMLEQLKNETTMQVYVKGIVTGEDALACLEHGADGIIVSNHGGRGDESGRGAIDSLAEVAAAVKGRTTLMMDSGIRRGVDIFKALALGADAVMVGRPYVWGLGAFGQSGVERALEILTEELRIAMQSFGTPSIADIGPDSIGVLPGGYQP